MIINFIEEVLTGWLGSKERVIFFSSVLLLISCLVLYLKNKGYKKKVEGLQNAQKCKPDVEIGHSLKIGLPKKLMKSIKKHAVNMKVSDEAYVIKILESSVVLSEFIRPELVKKGLPELVYFLKRIPSITIISSDICKDYKWWVKFNIDIEHELAWSVVQNLGFVLNYISLTERLPTIFMPVSPPPYLNGDASDNLSWVIESSIEYLDPSYIASILEERLPNPVNDISKWILNEEV